MTNVMEHNNVVKVEEFEIANLYIDIHDTMPVNAYWGVLTKLHWIICSGVNPKIFGIFKEDLGLEAKVSLDVGISN